MGWYQNLKARREADKAGRPRPLRGRIADEAKKARKREHKLARRGTSGPS
jgi:hypothetical protein